VSSPRPRPWRAALAGVAWLALAATGAGSAYAIPAARPAPGAAPCAADGPEYYAFPLVTTRRVPGTGLATGTAEVSVAPGAPFTVALAGDGSYRYRLSLALERVKVPDRGRLVAWVSTPDLGSVRRIGPLGEDLAASGDVEWNKFLVIVTLEPEDDASAGRWTGPVVLRGMSRSGMMHTMVGHGAFQQENCAAYGY
jgi:hypothetical protein